jgi:hypothetical protein
MTPEERDDEIVFILDCDTEVVFIPLIPIETTDDDEGSEESEPE